MQLGCTILYVPDVPATLKFYEAAFGLTTRFLHENGDYGELETGSTALALSDLPAIEHNRPPLVPHAVSRLRTERLAQGGKPFRARGGSKGLRCSGCRLMPSHCVCALRPVGSAVLASAPSPPGVCLLMGDIEPLKPSNTGWLIADVVDDTFAFAWSRTSVDPALLALLADPQWQPYVVFPGEFVAEERVTQTLLPHDAQATPPARKRPLFILLDGTWAEARKMFRKSPYLDALPVLSLQPAQASRYLLRRSKRNDHFCTAEVGAMCLALSGQPHLAQTLDAYLDVFTHHYLKAKDQQPPDLQSAAHLRLQALRQPGP
jgi:DTW domain-containing protein